MARRFSYFLLYILIGFQPSRCYFFLIAEPSSKQRADESTVGIRSHFGFNCVRIPVKIEDNVICVFVELLCARRMSVCIMHVLVGAQPPDEIRGRPWTR